MQDQRTREMGSVPGVVSMIVPVSKTEERRRVDAPRSVGGLMRSGYLNCRTARRFGGVMSCSPRKFSIGIRGYEPGQWRSS